MTARTTPTPRTKKPTTIAPTTPQDAPQATPIDWLNIDTSTLDVAELERLAALAEAETATMEATLTARLRALDAERATLTERATNIRTAGQLLTAQTQTERRTQAQTEANTARATQEQAYEADLEQRRRLFARAQELTQELAAAVKDALAVDARIYAAALTSAAGSRNGR